MSTKDCANTPCGLTEDEVLRQIELGLTNQNTEVKTKSIPQIVRMHAITLFNVLNLVMCTLVMTTGEFRNVSFIVIVVANVVIGVWQEIRAKRQVDALSIVTAKRVRVVRDSKQVELATEDIVLGDVVLVSHGDQIPADGEVILGDASVNESLLTGEADAIEKSVGSEVFSGSFVETGSMYYKVTKVGKDGLAAQINAEAKYVKKVKSEIVDSLALIIKLGTYVLVPLGILLFIRIISSSRFDYHDAILQTVAALVGMIPQGFVLLTSSIFAIATTRLAMRSVLVQQTYCVEALARVDVLCLDKTGTITSGHMEVASVCDSEGATGDAAKDTLAAAFAIVSADTNDANETARAILNYGQKEGLVAEAPLRHIPFNSKYKYSGVICESGAYVLGAAQFVLLDQFDAYKERVRSFSARDRVLVVANIDGFSDEGKLQGVPKVLGFIAIRDEIRENAAQTIAYFAERGVDVRVISGDDPYTVSHIARAVGLTGAEKYVDASTLTTNEDIEQAVEMYKIFGRVTPQMKRSLVAALKSKGHIVAMTGDGVNDILALKEADCSVAMASGSAAARNVAEIVLADNDFAHMPEVVSEGRRSINNLQRSATLFLVKTVYSAILAVIALIFPPYPFIPVQMSLISAALIGVPSFILALEPNYKRVEGHFLPEVLKLSLPASIAIVFAINAAMISAKISGWNLAVMSTMCMYLMATVGLVFIYRIARPLNVLRAFVLCLSLVLVVLGSSVAAGFFSVASLDVYQSVTCLGLAIVSVWVFIALARRMSGDAEYGRILEFVIEKIGEFDGTRR